MEALQILRLRNDALEQVERLEARDLAKVMASVPARPADVTVEIWTERYRVDLP